jgi:hypothetical protein
VTFGRADAPVMASIRCFTKLLSAPFRSRSRIRSIRMKAMLPLSSTCLSLRATVA